VTVAVAVAVVVAVVVTDSVAVAVEVAVTVDVVTDDGPSPFGVDESSLFPTITAAAVPPMTSPAIRPARAATQPWPPLPVVSAPLDVVAALAAGVAAWLPGCSARGRTAVSSDPEAEPGCRCSVQPAPSQ
jgi:hypothetical protein